MDVKPQFDEFIASIALSDAQLDSLRTGHLTLRDRLWAFEGLKEILVSDFLQGSYRRYTAVRPTGDKRADVDIVVVTNLNEQTNTPQQALSKFRGFLDKYYSGKWKYQGRSIGIELSYVDLDVVPTSAPTEVARGAVLEKSIRGQDHLGDWYEAVAKSAEPAWKSAPLRIPDRIAEKWDDTDPLEQLRKTSQKNKKTGGLFVKIVRAIKWWRMQHADPIHPKGYPIEHLVFVACPDDVVSIADGVTRVLEGIAASYKAHAALGVTPFVPDHGVPAHNVLGRVSGEDFREFHALIEAAAAKARAALEATTVKESCDLWRALLGKFPEPPTDGGGRSNSGGFVPPSAPSSLGRERFA